VVEATLDGYEASGTGERTVEDVLEADAASRRLAERTVRDRGAR
jgi:hypothetical protein